MFLGRSVTGPTPEIIEVDARRLQYGTWSHDKEREENTGDIRGSYSADIIAMEGRVRKPFEWRGSLCICTGSAGSALTGSGREEHEAYLLVPLRMFEGTPTTYREKTGTADAAEAARNDPLGFYNAMAVVCGKEKYVLCGPELRFVAIREPGRPDSQPATPSQLNLFA